MAKNRNEIPKKLTWDLTTIYKTDKEWEAELTGRFIMGLLVRLYVSTIFKDELLFQLIFLIHSIDF